MHFTLLVVTGTHQGRLIPVTQAEFVIGRSPRCQLRPLREDVSRKHCTLLRRGERLFLRDEGSSNGTILNRRTLVQGEMPVTDGDEFEVGPLRFRVLVTPTPPSIDAEETDDDSVFAPNEIYGGLPGEREPSQDRTIEVTRPHLGKLMRRRPLSDEIEKLS
jgi:predicted component of type VI protein secretion system